MQIQRCTSRQTQGVLTSVDGEHWRVITDKTGVNTIIDRMTVVGTAVYGVGNSGAHLLSNRGEWEKISPEVAGRYYFRHY